MKYLFCIISILFLADCNSPPTQLVPVPEFNKKYFTFTNKANTKSNTKPRLSQKIQKLRKMRQKYKLVKSGRIRKESSIVFRAIIDKPVLYFSPKNHYGIESIQSFIKSICSIQYGLIRGHSPEHPDIKIEAELEELIFNTEENAETLMSFIHHVRNIEYYWDSIDKRPSYMFQEDNRVYLIRMRRQLDHYPLKISRQMRKRVISRH